MNIEKIKSKSLAYIPAVFFLCILFFSLNAFADDVESLKEQIETLKEQISIIQNKLETLEKENAEKEKQVKEIDTRLNQAELHTATDKVSFGVELKTQADSIHYEDMRIAPDALVNSFFLPYTGTPDGGFNNATSEQMREMMAAMSVPMPDKRDADNDALCSTRLRLNMKSKINNQLYFAGRLTAYKIWGDSTGVKFSQGSLGDITFDGNTSGLPRGDTVHLERAYFTYNFDMASLPTYLSVGRRPSTEGPPLEYGNYSLEGGTPLSTLINWHFDAASFGFNLEDVTGIPGADIRFCYGIAFESDWGNSYSLHNSPDMDDLRSFAFLPTLYNNDTTSIVFNYLHVWNVTDGFTGLTVMPFIVSENADGTYHFEPNAGGFISRIEPCSNIGDWDAASLLIRTNLAEIWSELQHDIDLFCALSWTHTNPSQMSQNPFYKMTGQGLLSSGGELEERDGYAIYAGAVFPMPLKARLGLEYNWGSKYWLNFSGAEDALEGSKLAVRGNVFEAYYLQPIFGENFFLKLGGRYYDYDYTGSGNPLGKPLRISDLSAFDTLNAVADKVWNLYFSVTVRY